jgi:hypothetical protein
VEFPYSDPTGHVTVAARHADGSLDSRFGEPRPSPDSHPVTQRGLSPEALELIKAGAGEITLVATPSEHAEVQLIRLRL